MMKEFILLTKMIEYTWLTWIFILIQCKWCYGTYTEILEEEELKPFYDIYPEKFNNKTNGITFRRWLIHCNNELTNYITEPLEKIKTGASKLEDLATC